MKNNILLKMNNVIDKFEEEQRKKRELKSKTAGGLFEQKFREAYNKIIEPVFKEFEEFIESKNFKCQFGYRETVLTSRNVIEPASIRLFINPKDCFVLIQEDFTKYPYIWFIQDIIENDVTIYVNTFKPGFGGYSGPVKKCKLENIDRVYVENELLNFIEQIFAKSL